MITDSSATQKFPNPLSSMPDSPSDNIALLIDADNAPARKIEFIITELASHGVVNIRRAYGNWKKRALAGWEKVLLEYAIQPIQHFDLTKGKNATDMALVIEAMDLLATKDVQTFCLVTSDCDFTPLVLRIRSDGKRVIGFGERKTPEPFINSCSSFIFLDEESEPDKAPTKRATTVNELKGNTKLIHTLRSAVQTASDDDGWAPLGPVGNHISNSGPFDHRTYGFSKLSGLFEAIDLFEVWRSDEGVVRVRCR